MPGGGGSTELQGELGRVLVTKSLFSSSKGAALNTHAHHTAQNPRTGLIKAEGEKDSLMYSVALTCAGFAILGE